ncbi:MAG: hypothetical protein M3122_01035 [Actinomycetota bacterium]|nr:hypothetical protein [Actinomycetota bacterium]
MLESFTVQTFSERLGEAFRVYPDASDPLKRIHPVRATLYPGKGSCFPDM